MNQAEINELQAKELLVPGPRGVQGDTGPAGPAGVSGESYDYIIAKLADLESRIAKLEV